MLILTNGHEFLHAEPIDALTTEAVGLRGPRRETLTYGPVQDSVAPQRTALWWGRFQKGERLRVEVQAGPTRGLRVEVLDQGFRPLGQRRCGAGVTRFEVVLEREGVHYVRLRHEGEREGRFLLRVLQVRTHAPQPATRGARVPFGLGWLERFRPKAPRPVHEPA